MNRGGRKAKITDLSEKVAIEFLKEYQQTNGNLDSEIKSTLVDVLSKVKELNDWLTVGKQVTDMYKMLQTSSKRHKEVADTMLAYTLDKRKIELEENKFKHKEKVDSNKTGGDEDSDVLSDEVKNEIRDIIKSKNP